MWLPTITYANRCAFCEKVFHYTNKTRRKNKSTCSRSCTVYLKREMQLYGYRATDELVKAQIELHLIRQEMKQKGYELWEDSFGKQRFTIRRAQISSFIDEIQQTRGRRKAHRKNKLQYST